MTDREERDEEYGQPIGGDGQQPPGGGNPTSKTRAVLIAAGWIGLGMLLAYVFS